MVRKVRKIRVYGYCKPPRPKFKLWFDIRYVPIVSPSKKERKKIREKNIGILLQIAIKEAKRFNVKYAYPKDERIFTLVIDRITVDIY